MIINRMYEGHIPRIAFGISLLAILLLVGSASAAPYAYVTNAGSNTVSVIDAATNTVTATVNVGSNPEGVAVNPDGTKVYVANFGNLNNNISVIDTATNTVIASINVGIDPLGIAVNPAGTKVYVANVWSNNVSVIDTSTNTVTSIDVGNNPEGVAVSPDGTKAYVTNAGSNTVSVIDAATNTVTATVNVGINNRGIAINPAGTRVYVTNFSVENNGNGAIYVIDTSTNKVTATVNVGISPEGVAVNPAGTNVYVTDAGSSNVYVIDAATNTVTATVNVGNQPMGVAVNPDGTKVYVANFGSNNVSVIDTATNVVTATINVGSSPWGVAVNHAETPTPITPTVHITANPPTHDINISTNFTFTANPVGSWGNNISYSWSIAYEKCSTAASIPTGQSISEYLDVACGNATISVTADDEKNNAAHDTYLVTVHEALPDLTVTNISFSKDTLVAGEPVKIKAKIANIGNADAKGDIWVNFSQESHYTDFNDNENGSNFIFSYQLLNQSEIKAGETVDVEADWNAAPVKTENPNGFINVTVNAPNINEINMENNKMYKSVTVNSQRSYFSAMKDGYHFKNFAPSESEIDNMKNDNRFVIDGIYDPFGVFSMALRRISIESLLKFGVCYGFSSTSILYNQNLIPKPGGKDAFFMMKTDQGVRSNIIKYQTIEATYVQVGSLYSLYYSIVNILKPELDIKTEYKNIADSVRNGQPLILFIDYYSSNGKEIGRHAITAYDVYESDSIKNALVYDSNYPDMARVMQFDFSKNEIIYEDYFDKYGEVKAKYDSYNKPHPTLEQGITMLNNILKEMYRNIVNYLFTTGHMIFSFHSPVNVTIKDQYGRIVNDEGINNIPGANIDVGSKMFVLPTNLDYTINISAYDSGNFSMTQAYPLTNWSASVISFKNISINKNTKATVDINSTNQNYTIKIDKNGDGIIDETKVPDSKETIVVDNTTSPNPSSLPAPSSGGSSGGGGGGGGGGGTSGENYTNIEVKEKYDLFIFKDKLTSYTFNRSNPILFVNITGNINAGETTATVEVLRNTSSLVNRSAPDKVYKNVNIWVGTSGFAVPKNIKEAVITFKVENSWLSSNNLESSDITMVRWNGSYWNQLETSQTMKDSTYTYYEAKTYAFSPFAIKGISKAAIPLVTTQSGIALDTGTQAGSGATPSNGTSLINWSIFIVVFAMVGIIIAVHLKRKGSFKK